VKLIEDEFGRKLYKELLKAYVLKFEEFPLNTPEDVLQEIKDGVTIKKQKLFIEKKKDPT